MSFFNEYTVYDSLFCVQAEDGIRDLVRSRGLGDVYKRQLYYFAHHYQFWTGVGFVFQCRFDDCNFQGHRCVVLSLIHI